MHRLKAYSAGWLLFAAIFFALPRAWVHDCSGVAGQDLEHSSDDEHDRISHDYCPFCELALTPSLEPGNPIFLVSPDFVGVELRIGLADVASPTLAQMHLRGPPRVLHV